ncbi:MAG: hypothetical protein GF418_12515 [Chitinivibrionales bacterium]|nr:hypothetical protein [Chitinivibrionales bacterium]MBD3396442.1 hypothetical protein [Chitinivibrionales bacterium]
MRNIAPFDRTRRGLAFLGLAILCVGTGAGDRIYAQTREEATIRVHEGPRQQYMGFGFGLNTSMVHGHHYNLLPETVKDSIYRLLFVDLNSTHLKLWSSITACHANPAERHYCADDWGPIFQEYTTRARKFQPNLVSLLGPGVATWLGETITNLDVWAESYAEQARSLVYDHGIQIDYCGIANEPDNHDALLDYEAPIVTKKMRAAFDALGLQDVGLVGPDISSTAWKPRELVARIIEDEDALNALDVFTTHSYNSAISVEMEALVDTFILSGEKQYWQTEASEFFAEVEGNAEQASSITARLYSDMNRLCQVWFFHLGIAGVGDEWAEWWANRNALHLILYREKYQDIMILTKFYYFVQFNRTFEYGCRMRKAVSNLMDVNPTKYWRREDTTMTYAFGDKCPLYLTAGVNEDSSWAIGLVNYTGSRKTPLTTLRPKMTYDVNVIVEELEDYPDPIVFNVTRNNAVPPYIHPAGTLTMTNGRLRVDSLAQHDQLLLRSPPGIMAPGKPDIEASVRDPISRRGYGGTGLRVARSPGSATSRTNIRFTVPEGHSPGHPTTVAVFDPHGAKIHTLLRDHRRPGIHTISWDERLPSGKRLAAGAYVLSVQTGSRRVSTRLMVTR